MSLIRKLRRRFRRKRPPTIHVTIEGNATHLQAALQRAREQVDRLGQK